MCAREKRNREQRPRLVQETRKISHAVMKKSKINRGGWSRLIWTATDRHMRRTEDGAAEALKILGEARIHATSQDPEGEAFATKVRFAVRLYCELHFPVGRDLSRKNMQALRFQPATDPQPPRAINTRWLEREKRDWQRNKTPEGKRKLVVTVPTGSRSTASRVYLALVVPSE